MTAAAPNPAPLRPHDGVAYRGIAGVRPLWWEPNLGVGRWHGPGQRQPIQYLALHPMGALAEQARHLGLRTAVELRTMRHAVFAVRVHLDAVLTVDFDTARALGLEPGDLVGPPHTYATCAHWLAGLLAAVAPPDGLVVPSAALPGTRNLIVAGARHPFPYDRTPRRGLDVPCAGLAFGAHPATTLDTRVVPLDAPDHAALTAWQRGDHFLFAEPRAAA